MILITFDPGETTGWALGTYSDTEALEFKFGGQISGGVAGFCVFVSDESLEGELDDVIIVSESFTLRPGVKMPNLTPIRIEGAMTALLGDGTVVYQQPSAKGLVPDATMKRLGLWLPGQRHQMDARIHAMAYMMKMGHLPTLTKYFPEQVVDDD